MFTTYRLARTTPLRSRITAGALTLTAVLVGCTATPQASLSNTAEIMQESQCEAFAEIPMGRYWLNNNLWGQEDGTGTQCVEATSQDGETIGWRTDWEWEGDTHQVKSFVSSVLGWHWGWKAEDTGLPVQLSDATPVPSAWDYTVTTDGTAAVTYDLWLHEVMDPDEEDDPADELMIWLSAEGGAGPLGEQVTTVDVAGQSWDLYRGEVLDDDGDHLWWVHSFVHTSGTNSFEADLSEFTDILVERDELSTDQYLTSVQAGVEVFSGTGELDTTAYRTTVG